MTFGEMIRTARREKSITQQDLADWMNVSRQTVSNWENDRTLPERESMEQLEDLLLREFRLAAMGDLCEPTDEPGKVTAESQVSDTTEKAVKNGEETTEAVEAYAEIEATEPPARLMISSDLKTW